MSQKGYQNVTLKDEVIAILDSLGDTRSNTIFKLLLQQKLISQNTSAASEGETPEALIAYMKERLPDFTSQQIMDLVVEVVSYLKQLI
jgi:hypothetical protein